MLPVQPLPVEPVALLGALQVLLEMHIFSILVEESFNGHRNPACLAMMAMDNYPWPSHVWQEEFLVSRLPALAAGSACSA